MFYRISDEHIILKSRVETVATDGALLRNALAGIHHRTLNDQTRTKVVVATVRDDVYDGEAAIRMLFDLEAASQQKTANALDAATPLGWLHRIPFVWVFTGSTRRRLYDDLAVRLRGSPNWTRRWLALMMMVSATLLVVAGDVLAWGWRVTGFFLLLAILPAFAYGADHHTVREQYSENMFAPVMYHGELPKGFGLPGYVADVPLKEMADGATLVVREPLKWEDTANPRDMVFAEGIVFDGYLPTVALPCQQNLLVAIRNRQIAKMPETDENYFWSVANKYLANVRKQIDVPDIDFDAWNVRFPRGRQLDHLRALEGWANGLYNDYDVLKRSGFMKVEKIMRLAKGAYDPRLISGASDAYNVVVGPWFHSAKKCLKGAFERFRNVVHVSSETSRELGEWFEAAAMEGGRVVCGDDQLINVCGWWIEVDGKRHDAHMTGAFLEFSYRVWEKVMDYIPAEVYRYVIKGSKKRIASNKQYGLKWTHEHRVCSGDPWTKDNNSVCADLVASHVEDTFRENMHLVDELWEKIIKDKLLRLGYEVEITITRNPEDVTFLSGAFYPVGGVVYWGPLPGRQLAKIGWSLRRHAQAKSWKEFAGILNSYRDYSFIPFLRRYVDIVSQLIPEPHRLAPPSLKWMVGPGITPQAPDHDTWDWFYQRYGLNRSDEDYFAAQLLAVDVLPYMIHNESVSIMVDVDLG